MYSGKDEIVFSFTFKYLFQIFGRQEDVAKLVIFNV